MPNAWTPVEAMTAVLQALPQGLRGGADVFPKLMTAAQTLQSPEEALVIQQLLGDSQYYGMALPPDPPPRTAPIEAGLSFPADHLMHLQYSNEWYWLSANLTSSDGQTRLGVLFTIHRSRLCSAAIQAQAGWTDEQAQVVNAELAIVVHGVGPSRIDRRDPSVHWAWDAGQTMVFPSETDWVLQCGGFVLTGGSPDVLPLTAQLTEPGRSLDLTFSTSMPAASAFFLQGVDGRTPTPRPGFYYSWPQLEVSGTVQIGQETWQVSGTGWIDHQLMMTTPPAAPQPAPPPVMPAPVTRLDVGFSGWNWCQFNFDNGDAYTGVAFQAGALAMQPFSPMGFFLQRTADSWTATPVVGVWVLNDLVPTLFDVLQPTAWTYAAASLPGSTPAVEVLISAQPWHPDGSFMTGNLSWFSEVPSTVTLARTLPQGRLEISGSGYCETCGFEVPGRYQARALSFLAAGGSSG
jgi:CrtC N-terminal lipocalin domain